MLHRRAASFTRLHVVIIENPWSETPNPAKHNVVFQDFLRPAPIIADSGSKLRCTVVALASVFCTLFLCRSFRRLIRPREAVSVNANLRYQI
jgi:hypothetical protein